MADIKESILLGYPNAISYECTKKILEQMEKNICKIKIGSQQGTGFFCKIPFPDKNKMLKVFITNNHIINNDLLMTNNALISFKIKEDTENKTINLNNRKKYTNQEQDITIIELKDSDEINNYLELDDNIINQVLNDSNLNSEYIDETVYIIHYPENKLSVSYGTLDKIYADKKYNFNHKCSTKGGSSGSPILNVNNNKIIGIHKEGQNNNNFNKGLFLNYPIKEYIKLYCNNDNNEMSLKEFNEKFHLNIENTQINKLYLNDQKLGYDGLNDLSKLKLIELKELYLGYTNISDIGSLERA